MAKNSQCAKCYTKKYKQNDMAKLLWEDFAKRFNKHFIGFYLKVKIKLKKNLQIKNSKPQIISVRGIKYFLFVCFVAHSLHSWCFFSFVSVLSELLSQPIGHKNFMLISCYNMNEAGTYKK